MFITEEMLRDTATIQLYWEMKFPESINPPDDYYIQKWLRYYPLETIMHEIEVTAGDAHRKGFSAESCGKLVSAGLRRLQAQ